MVYMKLNILIVYNILKFPIALQHFNSFLILFQILGPITLTENSHNLREHNLFNIQHMYMKLFIYVYIIFTLTYMYLYVFISIYDI